MAKNMLGGFGKSVRVQAFMDAAITRGKSDHFAVIVAPSKPVATR